MKNKIVTLIMIVLGCCQTALIAQSIPAQPATVHFYQGRAPGFFSVKYRVYADGKLLCKLGRKSHCQITLPAGTTTFTTKPPFLVLWSKSTLKLNLEAGKEYYIQGDSKFFFYPPQAPLLLTEIVPNSIKMDQINQSKEEPSLLSSTR